MSALLIVAASALAVGQQKHAIATGSWQPLTNQPTFNGVTTPILMTDGSVLVQDSCNTATATTNTNHWWKLTPDITGSYVNGTWSQLADMRSDYAPLFYASAVLKDGRVVVIGGEYNFGSPAWTNLGAIYDPVSNTWQDLDAPWGNAGDAECAVLPDGRLLLADAYSGDFIGTSAQASILDPTTMSWKPVNSSNKENNYDEEGWNLLPDGTLVTVDVENTPNAEKYIPWDDNWVSASQTPAIMTNSNLGFEMGPAVLRFDGTVFAFGATSDTAIYTPPATPTDPGSWAAGPQTPNGDGVADGPCCLLPNGNVFVAASPGVFNAPTHFYETDGTTMFQEPGTPTADSDPGFVYVMLVLPTGQVMVANASNQVYIYTPAGGPQDAWRPTITNCPPGVAPGGDFQIQGTQFNGLSQTNSYGDDSTNASNYPIVRITNNATGDVFYCRTHDHSTMAVATGNATVSTNFTVPDSIELGDSTIQVVANGIASTPVPIVVAQLTVKSLAVAPGAVPGGTPVTGTVSLYRAAPAGGLALNLTSSDPAAGVPSTVAVPEGETSATFPINTSNTTLTPVNVTISEALTNDVTQTASFTVNPANYSQFYANSCPTAMAAGQHYLANVQFKNTGATTWDAAHGFKVRSMSTVDNMTWGVNRIALSNGPVAPGQIGIFQANLPAPTVAGTYNFQWEMVQDNIGMVFGPSSKNVGVTVTVLPDAAQFVSQTGVPTTINAGGDFNPTLTFQNVGSNSWTSAGGYVLKSRNPYNNTTWGMSSMALPGTIAPGGTAVFSPTITAPLTPGTYAFQWSMLHGGALFGDLSNSVNVAVVLGPNDAQFVSLTAPDSVGPGTNFTGSIVMQNTGKATWDSSYGLVPINPAYNTNWGTNSVTVTGSIPSGSNANFNTTFTAPSTPGTYHFAWRMAQAGVFFGQPSSDMVITVSADAAQFVSSSQPLSVLAGSDFPLQVTMFNSGTTTWSNAGGYSLVSANPVGNTTWTPSSLLLPGQIAPGANGVISAICTAPVTPGTYTMQWQMSHKGVVFGDLSAPVQILVSLGQDDAKFVSQQGIPSTVVHGTKFTALITMKNLGTATWDSSYSLASIGSSNFGVPSIPAISTATNATDSFPATFTAPATPGTYTFQVRMSHNGALFGQAMPAITIKVS